MKHRRLGMLSAVLAVALSWSAQGAPAPSEKSMKATLAALVEALDAGNAAAIVALYADDAVIEDPVGTPPKAGKAAITKLYTGAVAAKAKLTIEKYQVVRENEVVVDVKVALGERSVPVQETYTFAPDGHISHMSAVPQRAP